MHRWIKKLMEQFDLDLGQDVSDGSSQTPHISEDRATLLYIIDIYNKHLIELETHPVRKTREILDEYAKELIKSVNGDSERVLFRFRQFFSSYRIDECSYFEKTFDDFRGIIWDFVDQLSEDLSAEQTVDSEMKKNLDDLKEAVESNSIDILRKQSRQFIDSYIELQTRKDSSRAKRIQSMEKSLNFVKKKLDEANQGMRLDHLTGAYNRKSFDEQLELNKRMFDLSQAPVTLITIDIDYFKRINDNFGHPTGDFILKECVRMLQQIFNREEDFIARIGGEEFAIILPKCDQDAAVKKATQALESIRKEIFVIEDKQLKFTISMGIAPLQRDVAPTDWLKYADEALYKSKSTGRDRYTLASTKNIKNAA